MSRDAGRFHPGSERYSTVSRGASVHGTRYEYELTPMGKDLATLMTALHQWGDRWIYGEGHEPLLVLDRRSGRRIPRLRILNNEGRPLAGHDSRGDTQWRQGRAMNVDALWTSARAIKG